MTIAIPAQADKIIKTLEAAGFEAYAVGGCVRDSLLGRNAHDWDITTSAEPMQVKSLFSHTFDTGIRHGTVSVLSGGECFEVTTYRIDGEYEDGRHPKEVTFTRNLEDDLKRRDFTINAMAYNPTTGLVDLYGGREDLKRKVIRCVGDPRERFTEDALRIMRAVRFASQLGYSLDPDTRSAMKELAPRLSMISAERVREELMKTITGDHPELLRDAVQLGITAVILPELDACMNVLQNNPHHRYTVGEHILHSVQEGINRPDVRLTLLLHDLGKASTRTTDEEGIDHFHHHAEVSEQLGLEILHRLRFDNDTIDRVRRLIRFHDLRPQADRTAVRKVIHKVGEDIFYDLLEVMRGDVLAQSSYKQKEKLELLEEIRTTADGIFAEGECINLKQLALTGRDLIDEGVSAGPDMGALLNRMLEDVLTAPEHNNREYLLEHYVHNGN